MYVFKLVECKKFIRFKNKKSNNVKINLNVKGLKREYIFFQSRVIEVSKYLFWNIRFFRIKCFFINKVDLVIYLFKIDKLNFMQFIV